MPVINSLRDLLSGRFVTRGELEKLMSTLQEQFDEKVARLEAAVENVVDAVTSEGAEINSNFAALRAQIEELKQHPAAEQLDFSGLDPIIARLEGTGDRVRDLVQPLSDAVRPAQETQPALPSEIPTPSPDPQTATTDETQPAPPPPAPPEPITAAEE